MYLIIDTVRSGDKKSMQEYDSLQNTRIALMKRSKVNEKLCLGKRMPCAGWWSFHNQPDDEIPIDDLTEVAGTVMSGVKAPGPPACPF